jgi:hypothetical protein
MDTSSFAYACMKIKQRIIKIGTVKAITDRFLISFPYKNEEIFILSYGMCHCEGQYTFTDVSEEHTASIFTVIE